MEGRSQFAQGQSSGRGAEHFEKTQRAVKVRDAITGRFFGREIEKVRVWHIESVLDNKINNPRPMRLFEKICAPHRLFSGK